MNKKDRFNITAALISLVLTLVLCGLANNKAPEPTTVEVPNISQNLADYRVDSFPSVELGYTEEELEILAMIIYQEAGGDRCSDDTRFKVGNVFLNRVASPLFPNTFKDVATAKSQYGALYWTGIKWPDRASLPQEQHAVMRAYNTARQLLEGKRVLPDNVFWQAEFIQGDGLYRYQDGIYFCYTEVEE